MKFEAFTGHTTEEADSYPEHRLVSDQYCRDKIIIESAIIFGTAHSLIFLLIIMTGMMFGITLEGFNIYFLILMLQIVITFIIPVILGRGYPRSTLMLILSGLLVSLSYMCMIEPDYFPILLGFVIIITFIGLVVFSVILYLSYTGNSEET